MLAALAKFADNFNQEHVQVHVHVHVREATTDDVGKTYEDGSFTTPSFRIELASPLSRERIDSTIEDSGLAGLTVNDQYLEFYYVGDPENGSAISEFEQQAERAIASVGSDAGAVDGKATRIWRYGEGLTENDRTIGYEQIRGFIHTPKAGSSRTAKRVAEFVSGRRIIPANQKLMVYLAYCVALA